LNASLPDPEEEQLVGRAIRGDAEAFGELYQRHREALYRYIRLRVGNPSDAEDLTGQLFLKAWEALPRYDQRGRRFSSWLYQIAHHLVIDHVRSARVARAAPLIDADALVATQPPVVDQVIETEESAALAKAVTKLPAEQQQVIFLRFFRGLDHGEVATILAKSPGASRVIQRRALVTLYQILSTTVVIAVLFFLLGQGAVYAARDSVPGDRLYPVKRFGEQVQLRFANGQAERASLHLGFAQIRLQELAKLALRPGAIASPTLNEYLGELAIVEAYLAGTGELAPTELRSFAAQVTAAMTVQEAELRFVNTTASSELVSGLTQANAAIRRTRDRAEALEPERADPPAPTPSQTPSATISVPTLLPTVQPLVLPPTVAPSTPASASPTAQAEPTATVAPALPSATALPEPAPPQATPTTPPAPRPTDPPVLPSPTTLPPVENTATVSAELPSATATPEPADPLDEVEQTITAVAETVTAIPPPPTPDIPDEIPPPDVPAIPTPDVPDDIPTPDIPQIPTPDIPDDIPTPDVPEQPLPPEQPPPPPGGP
jgi:RNA polymerase sigma-70 factor, ECF subfamily